MTTSSQQGVFQPLMVAALVGLASFMFNAHSEIAVLKTKLQAQADVIRVNTTYINQLNKSISKLDATLQVLNERLKISTIASTSSRD